MCRTTDQLYASRTAISVAVLRAAHQLLDGEPKLLLDPLGMWRHTPGQQWRGEHRRRARPATAGAIRASPRTTRLIALQDRQGLRPDEPALAPAKYTVMHGGDRPLPDHPIALDSELDLASAEAVDDAPPREVRLRDRDTDVEATGSSSLPPSASMAARTNRSSEDVDIRHCAFALGPFEVGARVSVGRIGERPDRHGRAAMHDELYRR